MRVVSMRSALRKMAPSLLACPPGTERASTGGARVIGRRAALEKAGQLAEAFSAAMKPLTPRRAACLRRPHQAVQGVGDGQFDARVLDLDFRRRSVRGHSDRRITLREKNVETVRETQRLLRDDTLLPITRLML